MLDVEKYTEDEYQELSALVFDLAHKFQAEWEADPFGDPQMLEYLKDAEEKGNLDTRDELAYVLEVYIIYFAPTPKLTEEQFNTRMKMVKEFVNELGSQSETDGGRRPTD